MLTESKFALRRFNTNDLQSVIEINRVCLPENYASFFFMDTYQSCPEAFLVAEILGRVVGYVMCRIEHGFSEFRRLRFTRKGHVISVAVLPEFRRMGMGNTLVSEALTALTQLNIEECYLEVRTTNEPAIRLYQKMGFDITRRVPHYYFDGADAYVMCRTLNGHRVH